MSLQFTVKDNFTMPPAQRGRGKTPTLPLRDLSIGKTMIVNFGTLKELGKLRSCVGNTAASHGMRFTTRLLSQAPEGKFAIQRIRANG